MANRLRSSRRGPDSRPLERGDLGAAENLAWLLATAPDEQLRNGAEAVRLAERVCTESGANDPAVLDALAIALAENGQFDRAVQTARQAIRPAESRGRSAHVVAIGRLLELFRNRQPYRE